MPYVPLAEALDQALYSLAQGYSSDVPTNQFPEHRSVLPSLLEIGAQLYSLADEHELVVLPMFAPIDWSAMLQRAEGVVPGDTPHPRKH